MRSKKLIEALAAIAIVLFVAAVAFPVFATTGRGDRARTLCLSNGKRLGLGTLLYASDYDERLPLAPRWLDDLDPYVKDRSIACPATPNRRYGYAMDESLAGATLKWLANPEARVVVFESVALIPNAAGDEGLLPNPGRHGGRNTIAYADGHAKWVRPQ
ncbi:MAG: prepilin-type N-terminal cleavage/methylation domain-containing protein [Fimbriimonas sp.]